MAKNEDDYLQQLCVQHQLSDDAVREVRRAVWFLFSIERSTFKSGPQRRKELKLLQTQAGDLCNTLRELDHKSDWRMQFALGELGFPGTLANPDAGSRVIFDKWLAATTEMLGQVAAAADQVAGGIPKAALRTGRPSKLNLRAMQVQNIAHAVCTPDGLTVARCTPFEDLCDAVFAAAGIRSGSAGTIAFLIKWEAERTGPQANLLWDY